MPSSLHFSLSAPLQSLNYSKSPICDAHVHIWDTKYLSSMVNWYKQYNIQKIVALAAPEFRSVLESNVSEIDWVFGYYLSSKAFGQFDCKKLITEVETAHSLGYKIAKCWFGPRFLDWASATEPFHIDAPQFEPVFDLIEAYHLICDIHIADPDVWYESKYKNSQRYRTKRQAIDEFCTVLAHHPQMQAIGVHLGCLPENLPLLSEILDHFPNYFIDTASTRWMIRELGKNQQLARSFFQKYANRILFATDLSMEEESEDYYATRLWSQRLFWETHEAGVELPFPDDDNTSGRTQINGLDLPIDVLERIYWRNAEKLFQK